MTKLTVCEVADFLRERDNFLILSHCRPDGDTVGSSAALCRGLRCLGKQAVILENPQLTPRYEALHKDLTCKEIPAGAVVVSTDVASGNMLPVGFSGKVDLRIDHHGRGESFGEYELVEAETASCGQIIYKILMALGLSLDVPMAEAVYTAVSTDTGCFRFSNTTAHSFLVAAACAEAGCDIYALNQKLFETVSLSRLRLQGRLTETARFFENSTYVLCTIPYRWEEELGLTEDDIDNISSYPRTIAGVKLAATLRENADGTCKLSVRSVPGVDSSALCAIFGGGGHAGAAGATIKLPLNEAERAVENAMLGVSK